MKQRFFGLFAISIVVLGLTKLYAVGQNINVGYEYYPYSEFKDAPSGSLLDGTEVKRQKFYANAQLPYIIIRGGKSVLVNSIYAENITLENRNSRLDLSGVDEFTGIDTTFTWIETSIPKWKTMFSLKPGLYYDGYDASEDIYRIQGMLTAWRALNPNMELGLGGGYVNEFGNPQTVPFIGLRINSGQVPGKPKPGSHTVDILIPVSASYFYTVNEKFDIGAKGEVSGGKYRVTRGSADGDSMEISVKTVGPSVRWTPIENCVIELNGGAAFRRRYQLRDSENNLLADYDLKNSSFLRLTTNISF